MDLLLTVSKDRPGTLRAQIEEQLRTAIRDGSLRAGTPVPSTRDLAGQIGVSRKVAVDAYAQLAAEGYLAMRQGAQPRVAAGPFRPASAAGTPAPPPPLRFDFLPARPDVSSFPREAWARCLRDAVTEITVADLGYGDAFGVDALREGSPATWAGSAAWWPTGAGWWSPTASCRAWVCSAVPWRPAAPAGSRLRIRVAPRRTRSPRGPGWRRSACPWTIWVEGGRAGAERCRRRSVTPAHQHPTGVVLAPERRAALVAWLRDRNAVAIEDDYDAEYRYDRPAVGALQGLDHDHVVYAGTTSKVLAPALRLGWLVVPRALVDAVRPERLLVGQGTARIEQLAFARFLARGDLDRHLRRMRIRYRTRRDAMVAALAAELPEARVRGIAAACTSPSSCRPADDEVGGTAGPRRSGDRPEHDGRLHARAGTTRRP